jgi:hypothetical protein
MSQYFRRMLGQVGFCRAVSSVESGYMLELESSRTNMSKSPFLDLKPKVGWVEVVS